MLLVFCSNWSEVFKDKGLLGMERFKDASVVGIFLCAGLAIPLGQMRSVALNWKLNIFSLSFGFFATPALMLCLLPVLRDVLKFPEPICTGFLILSALPASIGAPIALTRVAGGDGAVTLLNSVVSNLLGVVITPLVVVWLTGMHASIDEWAIIDKLTRVVAIPSLIGIALRHYVPLVGKFDPQWKLLQPLILLGLLANVFSNAFVSAQSGAGSKISSLTFSEIIGIAMAFNFSLISLLYACTMALRFSNGTSAAVIMTMSQKTAAMGVPLISVMFAGDPNLALLTAPLLCYHPVSAVFGGGIAALLRKRLKL
jgi:sodium/bile acid cotransporter 7